MKKIKLLFTGLLASLAIVFCLSSCGNNEKTIKVCASDVPHAEVLENCVKDLLKKQGYTLKITTLDWTIQNDAVANGDYDANYFQHIPYLETYNGSVELFATCKVHYEPLGIYSNSHTVDDFANIKATDTHFSFEICNDTSNAIRAFQLLEAKGLISREVEGTNFPYNIEASNLSFNGNSWHSLDGQINVTLIEESLLVSSLPDYDFACLPCNTAYTGRVSFEKRVAVEDDPSQVSAKANVLAVRLNDYQNKPSYKAKIDALTDALLSQDVSTYFFNKYLGAMTCDSSTQIDLR